MAEKVQKPEAAGKGKPVGYIGLLSFLGGMVLAIIGGIGYHDNAGIILALVIMGIFVGLLNITGKEVLPLLIAAIALIVVGRAGFTPLNDLGWEAGAKIDSIVGYLATFMAPAAVISAVRAIWALARPGD